MVRIEQARDQGRILGAVHHADQVLATVKGPAQLPADPILLAHQSSLSLASGSVAGSCSAKVGPSIMSTSRAVP